jgi:hypothetical protein
MFSLDRVVPWGRSFDEYARMFSLSEGDLRLRIVDCGGGPASFNAEATRNGVRVVSCDPLYRYNASEIRTRIDATYDEIIEQTRRNENEFVWTSIRSVEEMGKLRMAAMDKFISDYPSGTTEGRYVDAELPTLPFDDASFDLALSSHFLFLYSEQLGEAFHRAAVREMCRVATEVRVFPLLALGGTRSSYVESVMNELHDEGYEVSIQSVAYEFQRGGNEMIKMYRKKDDGRLVQDDAR